DAYRDVNLGRVSVHEVGTRIYTQLGTRIHTHNLGRVSIHTTWEAYLHTQSWDAYPFIQKIHNSSQQNHRKYIETSQNHIQITNKSQNIHKRFIEIHKTSQKSYTFTKIHILHIEFTKLHKHSLGGSQKITKIAIYIYIYIYTKKNQFKDQSNPNQTFSTRPTIKQ